MPNLSPRAAAAVVVVGLVLHPAPCRADGGVAGALDAAYPLGETCLLVPPLPLRGVFEPADPERFVAGWRVAVSLAAKAGRVLPDTIPAPLDPTQGFDAGAIEAGGAPLRRVMRPLFALFAAWWTGLGPRGEGLPEGALATLRAACQPGAVLVVEVEGDGLGYAVRSLLTGNVLARGTVPLGADARAEIDARPPPFGGG